jgi:hypothetical protein
VVVAWPGASNRFYSISRATPTLTTDAFVVLPGASNLTGTAGPNAYTDAVQNLGPVFYRIRAHP